MTGGRCGSRLLLLTLLLLSTSAGAEEWYHPEHAIPDEPTAVAVAEAVLKAVYGAKVIEEQLPLLARRREDEWVVTGTFHQLTGSNVIKVGGVATVRLSVRTGCVLGMIHGR